MKKILKSHKIIVAITIIVAIIAVIIILNNTGLISIKNLDFIKKRLNLDTSKLLEYYILDNQNEDDIKLLININSELGIQYVECADGKIISANNKNNLAFDMSAQKDETYTIKITENGRYTEKTITITDETTREHTADIKLIATNDEYKIVDLGDFKFDGFTSYFKIGENSEWQVGNKNLLICDYEFLSNPYYSNAIEDGNKITIYVKLENSSNHCIIYPPSCTIELSDTASMPNRGSVSADSLVKAVENYNDDSGLLDITVNDITYNTKIYSIKENLDLGNLLVLGTNDDVSTSSEEYAKNMIILRVDGDLTLNNTGILTSYKTRYGGPKGMLVYCTGDIINDGTITMTAKGAYAEGENVYLWKNADDTLEFVPAEGANGGAGYSGGLGGHGNKGYDGTMRQTAGRR